MSSELPKIEIIRGSNAESIGEPFEYRPDHPLPVPGDEIINPADGSPLTVEYRSFYYRPGTIGPHVTIVVK